MECIEVGTDLLDWGKVLGSKRSVSTVYHQLSKSILWDGLSETCPAAAPVSRTWLFAERGLP